MKVYIVIYYDEDYGNKDLVLIKGVFSKKDKAEHYVREHYNLPDGANIQDFLEEMFSLSGTRLDIREYEIDGDEEK